MNDIIANILLGYISGLLWADKYAGMVRIATRTTESGLKQYFPVACNVTETECNAGRYIDLIPNDGKKSVMYFEDAGGVQYKTRTGSIYTYTANLRLVCWLNLKKLGLTDCSATPGAIGDILRALPGKVTPADASPYGLSNVIISYNGEEKKDVSIFSKYSYNEAQTQYLLYPYDYFALNISVDFSMNENCLPTLTPGSDNPCNTH